MQRRAPFARLVAAGAGIALLTAGSLAFPPARPTRPGASVFLPVAGRGPRVAVLQRDLRSLGYTAFASNDGTFGLGAWLALMQFQRGWGLPATGGGLAPWKLLHSALGPPPVGSAGPTGGSGAPAAGRTPPTGIQTSGVVPGARTDTTTGSSPVQTGRGPSARGTSDAAGASGTGVRASTTASARPPALPAKGQVTSAPSSATTGVRTHVPAGSTATPRSPAPAAQTIDGRPIIGHLRVVATAYGPSLQDNFPYGPVDFFGQPLEPGMVAVDPSVIPLKSYLWVAGYSSPSLPAGGFLARAMDTGGAIRGDRIDIYIDGTPTQVAAFGIQHLPVTLLGG